MEEKKRPREPSEPKDDVSEGRRSTTPEPAKKKKKVDPVCSFTNEGEKNLIIELVNRLSFTSNQSECNPLITYRQGFE